jgi:hypothetical protein
LNLKRGIVLLVLRPGWASTFDRDTLP